MDSSDADEPHASSSRKSGSEQPSNGLASQAVMTGQKCQFKAYRNFKKKNGSCSVQATEEPFSSSSPNDSAFALVINRYFDENSHLEKSIVRINSFWILKTFREVIVSHPAVSSDFSSPFDLEDPYQMLLHSWAKLEERRRMTSDPDERMHLNFLFEFMNHEFGEERQKLFDMVQQDRVTYKTAWYVYCPGELLYTTVRGQPWILRCKSTAYEEDIKRGPYLEIHCTYTDHDGDKFGEAPYTFTLYQKKQFGGHQAARITDLPIYPLSVAGRDGQFLRQIEERGERYLRLEDLTVVAYNGIADYLKEPDHDVYDPEMDTWGAVWLPYTESGRLILDRKSFREDMRYAHNFDVEAGKVNPLLCPPYTYAYSTAHKKWCRPFLDKIFDVQWKQDVWDKLIVSQSERQAVRALVTSHIYPENARDQTQQKGKGLVILLHGSPGSGKTLTAETAAEGCHKALLCASLGELDQYNMLYHFQRALQRLLRLATVWNAVVLIDEADVLLEVRDDNQSSRNAMVAVFLRELEYFSGIIFLTTNRVETFDTAMKSRIHLSLGFKKPGIEMRQQIWVQNLEAIPAEDRDIDLSALDGIFSIDLNGREISNAVNTARTLARFEKIPLRLQHIQSILDVHSAFLKNLAAAKAADDGDGPSTLKAI